jgi:hypothetical protein
VVAVDELHALFGTQLDMVDSVLIETLQMGNVEI